MTMELEECIKDGFDDSLRDYIQSEEYVSAKQQERRGLAYLESLCEIFVREGTGSCTYIGNGKI